MSMYASVWCECRHFGLYFSPKCRVMSCDGCFSRHLIQRHSEKKSQIYLWKQCDGSAPDTCIECSVTVMDHCDNCLHYNHGNAILQQDFCYTEMSLERTLSDHAVCDSIFPETTQQCKGGFSGEFEDCHLTIPLGGLLRCCSAQHHIEAHMVPAEVFEQDRGLSLGNLRTVSLPCHVSRGSDADMTTVIFFHRHNYPQRSCISEGLTS